MSMLDETTGLWLSYWAQKIIPVSFREGRNEYFGKGGELIPFRFFVDYVTIINSSPAQHLRGSSF